MTIEEAIEEIMRDSDSRGQIARRGQTATAGNPAYEAGRNLDFTLCECSRRAGPGHDYIAPTPRGSYVYVGIDGNTRTITCGYKGHHYLTGTPPCR